MAVGLTAAPVLSTPDNHIATALESSETLSTGERLTEEQLAIRYEIGRTVAEIRSQRWQRVALQFPDHMLPHAAQVHRLLSRGLTAIYKQDAVSPSTDTIVTTTEHVNMITLEQPVKLTILGDTSYSSCCADEIAAEHVEADAIVHYGRSCLSPTARLPVLYVYTKTALDIRKAVSAFSESFPDHNSRVIITADLPYDEHVQKLFQALQQLGYINLYAVTVIHDPSSLLPNRTMPDEIRSDKAKIEDWSLFHVGDPPTALLLTLSSKVHKIEVYIPDGASGQSQEAKTAALLRRRYALVTSMNTVSTWGILINTLSVKNYLHVVEYVKRNIEAAGKKAYLFVVGKLNAAKVANFSEIGGWVVIGCWESSLIDSKDFFRPILTPFELDIALASDEKRVWTGAWRSDFGSVLDRTTVSVEDQVNPKQDQLVNEEDSIDEISEEESAPPEFDLRTGRYVSHTRPMAHNSRRTDVLRSTTNGRPSNALIERSKGEILAVNGVASPAAEFLSTKRTWKGLGSEFEIRYEDDETQGAPIEEGRSGIARGYTVGGGSHT